MNILIIGSGGREYAIALKLKSEKNINLIVEKVQKRAAPKPKIFFDNGENVRITEGPFANFTGIVEEYDMIHGKLRLNVSIFGRSTPVEILYSQVEKIV